jgi:hypothetical protein
MAPANRYYLPGNHIWHTPVKFALAPVKYSPDFTVQVFNGVNHPPLSQ